MDRDLLVERIARAQSAAAARATALRSQLPSAVALLKHRGARAVWLFGSLATGATPHAGTDVDLCVSGLSRGECAEALLDLEMLFGASVDLVRFESANAHVRERIARHWREITDVAG